MTTSIINVIDRNGVHVGVLSNQSPQACPFFNDIHREVLDNTLSTFTFSVPAQYPVTEQIEVEGSVLFRDLDGNNQLYKIKEINDYHSGEQYREVYCEHSATSELVADIVRPVTFSGSTARNLMDNILDGTGWETGQIDVTTLIDLEVSEHKTVLEVLHLVAQFYDAELEYSVEVNGATFTHKYINLREQRGTNTGKIFEYSKDVVSVRKEEDTTNLVTALIGIGNNGLSFEGSGVPVDPPYSIVSDYVANSEAYQRFNRDGKHIYGYYKDDSTDTPTLVQNTVKKLEELSKPVVTYTCEVALLERLAGYEFERVRIGDTVLVRDFEYNPPLVLEARVVELNRSLTDPNSDTVVLGDYVPIDLSNSTAFNNLVERVNGVEGEVIIKSPTPPTHEEGRLWMDTSISPNIIYRSSSATWVKASATEATEVGAEKEVTKFPTAPVSPSVDDLWIDTSDPLNTLNRFNGTYWEKVTPSEPSDIGAVDETQVIQSINNSVELGTIDIDRLTLTKHFLNPSRVISNNTPTTNDIQWSGVIMLYEGQSYTIADGFTSDPYVVWHSATPTVFTTYSTFPTLAEDDCLVFINRLGIATTVPNATVIDGDLIVPATISADRLSVNELSAVSATIGELNNQLIVSPTEQYDMTLTYDKIVFTSSVSGLNDTMALQGGTISSARQDTNTGDSYSASLNPTELTFTNDLGSCYVSALTTGAGMSISSTGNIVMSTEGNPSDPLDVGAVEMYSDLYVNDIARIRGKLMVHYLQGYYDDTVLDVYGDSYLDGTVHITGDTEINGLVTFTDITSGFYMSSTLGFFTSSGEISTTSGFIDGRVKMDLLPKSLAGRNGWQQHPTYTPTYSRDSHGVVQLQGLFITGTQNNVQSAFQLPTGYRPPTDLIFYCPDFVGNMIRVRIVASSGYGYIETYGGANPYTSYVCMNGISFVSSVAIS